MTENTTRPEQGLLDGITRLRDAGLDQIAFPTGKMEDWRFVGGALRALRGASVGRTGEVASLDALGLSAIDAPTRVVFVDGVFSSELSELGDSAVSVSVFEGEAPERHASVAGALEGDWFKSLHEETWSQGALIEVAKNTAPAGPVHLAFVSTAADGEYSYSAPRAVARVGFGSKLQIVEEHVSVGGGALIVPLVELEVAESARLDHVKIQRSSTDAHHVARLAVRLDEGAHYKSVTAHFGGALSRQDLYASIEGGNTRCELHGLVAISGRQVSDTHSKMDHAHAASSSDQMHKCVVGGKAHSVFNGTILVRQDAQQINAFQLNRNLLLSPGAKADTKPQLEIFADDVKCSHGATIGQLDEDQLFYLRARGIEPGEARGMLTYAFAAQVLDHVPVLSARSALAKLLAEAVR